MKIILRKVLYVMLPLAILSSCKNDKKSEPVEVIITDTEETFKESSNEIEVVTQSMDFIGPDTIPSGWNTFKYKNNSTEPHFILIDKYPEGKTIDTIQAKVMPPFDKGMELIMDGKMEDAMTAFGKLPEWFGQVVFIGGTGMVSPKHTGISTVKLEPGNYIMECYVKMPNGQFHVSMGMIKELTVSEEDNGIQIPASDVKIAISSTEGIIYEGEIKSGTQTFEVFFKDQIVHENFAGHDVNLVRLDENADLDALEAWMNWVEPKGLMSATAPKGVTFLGGVNNGPAGTTQYFTATLEPGKYAFISEVPNTKSKGLLKTFEVSE